MIIENFLKTFDELQDLALNEDFKGTVNPIDSVFYPDICTSIPAAIINEIKANLNNLMGYEVSMNTVFMRRSSSGVPCPHQCHTDSVMGKYSLMVYLNKIKDCQGGTSFVRHIDTGVTYNPVNEYVLELLNKDINSADKWVVDELVEMAPNKAFIFDSGKFHRAEPVGGFGDTNENSRVVLTVFYD